MTDCLDFHLSLRVLIHLGIKKPAYNAGNNFYVKIVNSAQKHYPK